MELTPKQAAKVFAKLRTLEVIGKYFLLTDEQLEHPDCGHYLEQILKNMETPAKLLRQSQLQKDFPTSAFNPPPPGTLSSSGTPEIGKE